MGSTPGDMGRAPMSPLTGPNGGHGMSSRVPLDGGREREITQGGHGMSSHVSGGWRAGNRGGRGKNKPLPPQSGGDMG